MALKKITTYKGYDAEYWRIIGIHILPDKNRVQVRWALYKDKETRDANYKNYIKREIQILGVEFIVSLKNATDNSFSLIYTEAKKEFLVGAEDI